MRRNLLAIKNAPISWWILSIAVSTALAIIVGSSANSAMNEKQKYGDLVKFFAATRSIEVGETLKENDFVEKTRPASMLPTIDLVKQPSGRVANVPILKNEAIHEGNVGKANLSKASSQLKENERGVAIERTETGLTPAVGDLVDVIATFSNDDQGSKVPATTIAVGARVIATSDTSSTLAVNQKDAEVVAYASTQATVALALTLAQTEESTGTS